MYKFLIVTGLLAIFVFTARAQNPDTTSSKVKSKAADTLKATHQDTDVVRSNIPKVKKPKVYHIDTTHSAHLAVMHSLMIPGWGQVYNHRIWKVPIVYGTLGLIGWAYVFNAQYYKEFLQLSIYRNHLITPGKKDPYYTEYNLYSSVPDQSIYDAKDGYRRNRDLSILGFIAFWGVQTIDAYIDAKFIHSYTLDNNFSMHVTPTMIGQPVFGQSFAAASYIPGLKITLTL
ncbi:MAG: DUF5683 domain-containing protein [Bacteroidota bacterium]|nr:DUF5683 domain-containing protein [Bacteroidota bacterium]